jgi:hypothetical protein
MGAAVALLLLLTTLGIAACMGDGFTAGGLAAGGRPGVGGAATSNASGGAGGVASTSSGGEGGMSSTLAGGGTGGVGGGPLTTSGATGGSGGLITTSVASSTTESASSTAGCGCPIDAPTAGYPCCVPSGNSCTYGDCASGGQTDARCKGGAWFIEMTCATKCGFMGAPCEPGEICLSKGPIEKLARSCVPDPCAGIDLDCACAKPALCPEEDYSCTKVALDVIQCLN